MKTFCVPSHHSISANPLAEQGVLLAPAMFKNGIWYPTHGSTEEGDNSYEKRIILRRSENQAEYTAVLNALMSVQSDNRTLKAVISMRWCTLTYRLVTSKRVWLGIYRGEKLLKMYSHKQGGSPTYNFCDCWENPEHDQKVWETRFGEVVLPKT